LAAYRLALDHFMENAMRAALRVFALIAVFFWAWPSLAAAQPASPPPNQQQNFTPGELVSAGQEFFGTVSRGLASVIETAVSRWGLPNGYVLGEEGGGAFFGGLRYGEGMLYTKNAGDLNCLPPAGDRSHLRALWRHQRIGLLYRLLRDDGIDGK
jgi:hypothetical protein